MRLVKKKKLMHRSKNKTTWKAFNVCAVLVYNWVLHSDRKHCFRAVAELR